MPCNSKFNTHNHEYRRKKPTAEAGEENPIDKIVHKFARIEAENSHLRMVVTKHIALLHRIMSNHDCLRYAEVVNDADFLLRMGQTSFEAKAGE